jgi:hypothetical protein
MANLQQKVSESFTLGELLRSDTAERDEALKAQQYNPPGEVVANLEYLATTALQPVRNLLGYPLRITSGYRCPAVNQLVGSKPTSQHVRGQAADCQLPHGFLADPATVAIRGQLRALRPDVSANFLLFTLVCLRLEQLDIDQVIHEFGDDFGWPAWVHIAASQQQNRRQILFVGSYTNKEYVSLPAAQAVARGGAA